MSTSKAIDKICIAATAIALVIAILMMYGENLGITAIARTMGYENRLFSTDKVHTVDIVMDDVDGFFEDAMSEEYVTAAVVIDGESYKNIALRAKGNTSLSNVADYGNNRYSLKIEFDHYDKSSTYHGLDKLCLNNIIQDNTYMKDYLVYNMMLQFGVDAPLCSFAYITINGEDFGLYLAVEGIEDSFMTRYFNSEGNLYKPDSMSMGGGKGMGKDFNMDDFDFGDVEDFLEENDIDSFDDITSDDIQQFAEENGIEIPDNFDISDLENMPEMGGMPDMGGMSRGDGEAPEMPDGEDGEMPEMPEGEDDEMPEMPTGEDGEAPEMPEGENGENPPEKPEGDMQPDMGGDGKGGNQGGGMDTGRGSSDVKLQYIDDDYDSYSNIFDNAKTDITDSDKDTLIASLKKLSDCEDLENVVDIDEVLRYWVVHNYVVNGDSYTGSMIHNYYLYENEGKLSMIPWDYNLAFGGFQGGNASSTVNDDIDSPLSTGNDSRPMWDWVTSSDEYTEAYHEYFSEFLAQIDIESIIDNAYSLIAEYVEKDPTKFCTYDEFVTGVETLKEFCSLRTLAVENQLAGIDEQVDSSGITLSDMGSMNNTMGGMSMGGEKGDMSFGGNRDKATEEGVTNTANEENGSNIPDEKPTEEQSETQSDNQKEMPGEMPSVEDGEMPEMPNGENGEMPEMPSDGQGKMPGGEQGGMPDAGSNGTST